MHITNELGQEIIKRVSENIALDINIMDLAGKIVASTNEKRINQVHSGAIEVIKTNNALILDEYNLIDYPNTKPGVNLPIIHQGKIRGIVGVSGNPQEILHITGLIRTLVEIVIEQIYSQRQAHYKEVRWNNWLHELLHPSGFNQAKLEEDATYSLDINTNKDWTIILIEGKNIFNYLDPIRLEVTNQKINTLFILPFLENKIIICLPSQSHNITDVIARLSTINHCLKIGIGDPAHGISGIKKSYLQAKQALQFAVNQSSISFISDWKIERLTQSISADEYDTICSTYEAALDDLGGDYFKTINTYLQMNLSIKETSESLHIHRNTLLYRLDQIKSKVGLDPRVVKDLVILYIIKSRKKHSIN